MKQTSRKLLSLLMALAIVLSLLPGTAFAAGTILNGVMNSSSTSDDLTQGSTVELKVGKSTDKVVANTVEWSTTATENIAELTVGTDKTSATLVVKSGITSNPSFKVIAQYECTVLGSTTTQKYRVERTFSVKGGITSVTVSPKNTSVEIGKTVALKATVVGASDTAGAVTWESDNTSIATVDSNGVVTGVAKGTVIIKAKSTANPAKADAATVKVIEPLIPDEIALSGKGVSGSGSFFGLTMTTVSNAIVTAAVQTKNDETITGAEIDTAVSNNPSVCTVTKKGNTITVTPVAAGVGTITVTYGSISTTLAVTITSDMATVTFSPSSPLSLQVLKSEDVTANVQSSVNYSTVEWKVVTGTSKITAIPYTGKNQNVATIRGDEAGTATVTATFKNSAGTTVAQGTLTVNVGTTTGTLPLSPSSVSVGYNASTTNTVYPTNVSSWPTASYIDWTISGLTGAALISDTYNANGSGYTTSERTYLNNNGSIPGVYVYGRSTGTATLTAVLKDRNGVALAHNTVTVTVGTTNVLSANYSSITVPYGSWSNGIYATANRTGDYVVWSVPSNGYITISTDRTATNGRYSVTTNLSNYTTTPYIYLYNSSNSSYNYSTTLTATLYRTGYSTPLGSIQIPVNGNNNGFTLSPSPSNTSAVYLNEYNSSSNYYRDFSVVPYLNNTNITNNYNISYVWTLNGYTVQNYTNNANNRSYRLYANNQYLNSAYWNNNRYNTLTCTAYVNTGNTTATPTNYTYTTSVSWNVYTGTNSQFTVSATVYDSNPGYALTDTPDVTSTSIADQIDTWVRNNYYYGTSSSYRGYQVRVYGGTNYENGTSGNRGTLTSNSNWLSYSDLNKIVFTPGSTVSTTSGSYQISFNFDVRFYDNYNNYNYNTASGTMVFTVRQGTATGGNINYSAQLGKDVTFSVSDFEDFWSDLYSRGSLSYVTFGTVTGGTVYNSSNRSVGTSNYYANPSSSQSSLSGVYFSPNSSTSKKAGTVRIPFTARGTTTSGSSAASATRSGSIVITYLAAAANTITYSTNVNGAASLKAQDFIDAYKKAVNTSSTPSNLTIVFQDVPSYGTLSYKNGSSTTKLTSSSVKNRSFTTKTSGTNQLGDVTYTASGSRTETISYIGYIGSTATFTGDVTFNAAAVAPTDVRVTLPTCYSTAGVAMNLSYFTGANPALLNASYVSFGTPRTGKLSNTYASTTVSTAMLSGVTYVPAASPTSTTDSFTFTAYNTSGTVVASGTVSVVVSLPANPNAITNINQFTDIPAVGPQSDWYRPQLTYLINKGVINGTGNGKFGPEDALTYGAALKMIMNAAGYYEAEADENQAGVSDWAQNYKATAVQKGWMANSVNLKATISRDSMAELTAKVLGISPVTNQTSPFADSTNAYAIALYNNKIVQGELWDDGSRHFTPTKALTRNEMVCLVYNMYQFTGK